MKWYERREPIDSSMKVPCAKLYSLEMVFDTGSLGDKFTLAAEASFLLNSLFAVRQGLYQDGPANELLVHRRHCR
jgi:hypothetical protein